VLKQLLILLGIYDRQRKQEMRIVTYRDKKSPALQMHRRGFFIGEKLV